jgi:hypothetical protein
VARLATHPVPFVAIQSALCQAFGRAPVGSAPGGSPMGKPPAASSAAYIRASSRCPASLGCSRSTPHIAFW